MNERKDYLRDCLATHRQKLGLTKTAAAEICGVSRSEYAHAEAATKPVSLEKLIFLAESFGLSVILHAEPKR